MKTTIHFKAIIAFLMLPMMMVAHEKDWTGKYTKEKTIHKEYDVNATATLKVGNSYGNLDITTWNENRIVIDVFISTNGNNEEKVQKKLDDIDVKFSASDEWVAAETQFNKRNSKRWWSWGNDNVSMKINYVIKLPASNNVILSNDYGTINLDKLDGRADINCDYGTIITKELMGSENKLNFDYTKNSYFEYVNNAKINADYSDYKIAKAKNLEINADYSSSHIEVAEDISYNCDYGNLKVDNVNSVEGNGDYLTLRLGTVYKDLNIEGDYGSMKVENMAATAGDVYVSSDYMKITIGYDPGYSFEFDLDLQYASLKGKEDLEITKEREQSGDKYYFGYHGDKSTSNRIKINSEYGGVTFKKN